MIADAAEPRVSVIMSVHNGQKYLRSAVRSILDQTFADFEFLIVNDGSVDGSARLLSKLARADRRVIVIDTPNQGLTKSLNLAIRRARGKFIARMDADDISLPQRFEIQLRAFDQNPELVIVGSEVLLVDSRGWPIGKRGVAFQHEDIDRRLLNGDGGAMTHPVVMMRTQAVRDVGGYDERFTTTQDLDLFLRLAEIGKAVNLPEILLLWRQHPESINHRKFTTWSEMKRMALTAAAQRRNVVLNVDAIVSKQIIPTKEPLRRLTYARQATANRYYVAGLRHAVLSTAAGEGFWAQMRLVKTCVKGMTKQAFAPALAARVNH
ncbi:MAG TPA: glycosyltransferase [Verrucomicrobiae bacterium]|nr:glycosyltransferase [Verrucomicrobiae bacterium]